jgi:predicted AlkP superfamily phosphohydrolase/phosphomutase/tetratricopeptide (TPR) repeat protein
MQKRRVLVVGWDAADWKVIEPLMAAGQMPHLARLVDRGVMGNIATLEPVLSPMLWTSIATGKRPYKHGVLGFSEVVAQTGVVRPVSSLSRRTKAIWNILHQEGLVCHVIGWWPSQPVEPVRGVMVSNHFHVASTPLGTPWPVPRTAVHPEELGSELADLRIHPLELDGETLQFFVPRAAEIDQQADRRLVPLAKVIAECASVNAVASHVLATRPDWDFAAVYLDAIDHFSHGFMRYHPPRLPWIPEPDFELYSRVISAAYVLHDRMLGGLLELAGDDATVIVLSDHGFHPDHLRPRVLPNEPAGPAAEHRRFGMFVAAGPGIRRDELVGSASLLDVTPTLLSLYGLPVGRDMDGRVLAAIYDQPPAERFIDSWDAVPGDAALNPPSEQADSEAAAAMLKQMADLGYIDAIGDDRQKSIDQTVREERYNLARALVDGGRLDEAAVIFADLWDRWPNASRFGVHLLQALLAADRVLEARETFGRLQERKQAAVEAGRRELDALLGAIRRRLGLAEHEPVGGELLPEAEQHTLRQLVAQTTTNRPTFAYLEGSLLAAEGRWSEALVALDAAAKVQTSQQPSLQLKRAEVLLKLRRPQEALAAFAGAAELDPLNAAAHLGAARVSLALGDVARAGSEARAAITCNFDLPQAHVLAGLAAWRQTNHAEAERFLRNAVEINPVFPAGQRTLAAFEARVKRDYAAASERLELARQARRRIVRLRAGIRPEGQHPDEYQRSFPREAVAWAGGGSGGAVPPVVPPWQRCVVVVTGLPRSGTSMMMQMLAAGGIPVMADDLRAADENNQRGYLEFDPVKRLAADNGWLRDAVGRAVKIVSPLLAHLDKQLTYRIVHMVRPVREVVASQRTMVSRLGRSGADISDEALVAILERQLAAARVLLDDLRARGRAAVVEVAYVATMRDPQTTAARLADFFALGFDDRGAAAAVDPLLYRSTGGGGREPPLRSTAATTN